MKYTIKVWIFTVLIAPFLLITLCCVMHLSQIKGTIIEWPMLFLMILYGLIFSAPAMIFFGLIVLLIPNQVTSFKSKVILSLYSFLSVWVTFYFFDRGFIENSKQLIWVIIYSLTIVIGVWIFKLKKDDNNKIDNQNQRW